MNLIVKYHQLLFSEQWSNIMDKLFDFKNNVNLTPCRAQLTHETYLWKKDIHYESDLVTVDVCGCAVQN